MVNTYENTVSMTELF